MNQRIWILVSHTQLNWVIIWLTNFRLESWNYSIDILLILNRNISSIIQIQKNKINYEVKQNKIQNWVQNWFFFSLLYFLPIFFPHDMLTSIWIIKILSGTHNKQPCKADFWPLIGLSWPLLNTTGIIDMCTAWKLIKNTYANWAVYLFYIQLYWSLEWPLLGLYAAFYDILGIFKGF